MNILEENYLFSGLNLTTKIVKILVYFFMEYEIILISYSY